MRSESGDKQIDYLLFQNNFQKIYYSVCQGNYLPIESLMHWFLLPETSEESVRFICEIVM